MWCDYMYVDQFCTDVTGGKYTLPLLITGSSAHYTVILTVIKVSKQ